MTPLANTIKPAFGSRAATAMARSMSQSSWLVAGIVPGVERQPLKKLAADEIALLKLLHRWREETEKAGRKIERTAAIVLSLFRHVRHSYRPHTMVLAPDAGGRWTPVPATPGAQTEPGLVIYRFGADLFYANDHRFTDEVRSLVEHAPTPVCWFIVDADAITDIDYSAARSIRELLDDLAHQSVGIIFARVSPYGTTIAAAILGTVRALGS